MEIEVWKMERGQVIGARDESEDLQEPRKDL